MSGALVGNFSGDTLTGFDPETGFLIKSNHAVDVRSRDAKGLFLPGHDVRDLDSLFTPQKKLAVLNSLYDYWPDVSKACSKNGVSRWTFTNHYATDKAFAECVDEIRERFVDHVEGVRFTMANQPSGTLDRMAVLNAYRAETYNPKVKIEVEHKLSREQAQQNVRETLDVVDAEVIETVKKLKAQSRKLRPANPNPR